MINYPKIKTHYEGYIIHTKRLSIAFLLLGLAGILFPAFAGLTIAVFTGWILVFSGIFTAYYTFKVNKKSIPGWFKTILLIATGFIMIFNPASGVIALAVILAAYLFTDAVLNFWLAFSLKPAVNKLWAVFNGIISAILGIIFLYYAPNPLAGSWLLGLYVGISLLSDSLMLFQLSRGAGKIIMEELLIEQ